MLKKVCLAILDHFESYICQVLLIFFVITLYCEIPLDILHGSMSHSPNRFGNFHIQPKGIHDPIKKTHTRIHHAVLNF